MYRPRARAAKSLSKACTPVAWVFPGQGSQRAGMGLDLCQNFPVARAVFEEADEILGFSLSSLCFNGPEEDLRQTINSQPAILTASIACWKCAQELGLAQGKLQPAFVAGHSLGEYTALVAAGVLSFPEALRLVRERGRLMQEAGMKKPGGMVALLGMDEEQVAEVCQETGAEIANINCASQIIISGSQNVLSRAINMAKARGARRTIALEVSGAFHSSLMRWAMRGLKHVISAFHFHHPRIPIIANTTATPLTHSHAVRAELRRQLCRCVHWQRSVEYMTRSGVTTFVEIGPGDVLSGLIQRISPSAQTLRLGDMPTLREATS